MLDSLPFYWLNVFKFLFEILFTESMATHFNLPQQPSLASATGTRVDSACKHHHQCRVSTDDLLKWTEPVNNQTELQANKYRYCVHKDELVLSIGRPWVNSLSRKVTNNAYPRVTSNLGMWDGKTEISKIPIKMIKFMYHYAGNPEEKKKIIEFFADPQGRDGAQHQPSFYFSELECTEKYLSAMNDFHCMGYAQTLGWAHSNSGDTMTTVMIGGLRTVMNGDFEVYTNDVLQWYWPFELDCFEEDGSRKKIGGCMIEQGVYRVCNRDPTKAWQGQIDPRPVSCSTAKLSKDEESREAFNERSFGMKDGIKKMVPRIKPYIPDDSCPRMYDKMRVFAIAIGCARPHEMVDIKICRQSL